jgi:hypothetical protein
LIVTVLGIAASAILAGAIIGCDTEGPTAPTPTTQAPAPPVAAAPAPAPSPTPTPSAIGGADPAPSFTLEGYAPSTIRVTYNGESPIASVDTWYTSLDNQDLEFAKQSHSISRGGTLERAFGQVCIQADADQPGVKLIGGVFFDINGRPYNASKQPEKTKECRDRCTPVWREAEPKVTKGEWGECKPAVNGATDNGQLCTRARSVLTVITEVNSCTQETRTKSERKSEESEACQCPCIETKEPEQTNGEPSWSETILQNKCEVEVGPLDFEADTITPEKNCHQTGKQIITTDWLCQDDTKSTRELCRNVVCPCVNVPTYEYGTWSKWSDWSNDADKCGTRTRTREKYEVNSCTGAKTQLSDDKGSESKDCPPCYYRVSCGDQEDSAGGEVELAGGDKDCKEADQKTICENKGGTWLNGGALDNHCQFAVPGISNNDFQLNGGQSSKACKDKND